MSSSLWQAVDCELTWPVCTTAGVSRPIQEWQCSSLCQRKNPRQKSSPSVDHGRCGSCTQRQTAAARASPTLPDPVAAACSWPTPSRPFGGHHRLLGTQHRLVLHLMSSWPSTLIGKRQVSHLSLAQRAMSSLAWMQFASFSDQYSTRPYPLGKLSRSSPSAVRAEAMGAADFLQRFNANTSTPAPTMRIPSQSRTDGRSWRKSTANTATSTRLSLSTGATLEASPIFKARK